MQFTALWSVVAWCVLVALGWVAAGLAIAQWCVVVAAAVCGMVTLTKSAKLRYARVFFYDGAFAGAYYALGEVRRLLEFFATARSRFESRDGTLVVVSTFVRSFMGRVMMDKVESEAWYVSMVRVLAGSLSRVLQTLVVFMMIALVRHLLLRSHELGFFRRVAERVLAVQEQASDVVNQAKEFTVCPVGCVGCVQRRWVRELLGVALPVAAEEELAWCFSQSSDEAHRNAKHLWAMNGDALVKLFVVRFAMSFESAVPGEVSTALQLRTSNEAMLRALEKHEWFSEVKASYKDGYVSAKAGGTIFEALVHVAAKYSDGLVFDTSLRSGVLRALSVE